MCTRPYISKYHALWVHDLIISSDRWLMSDPSQPCAGWRGINLGLHSWLCHFLITWGGWVFLDVLGPVFLICKSRTKIPTESLRTWQTEQQPEALQACKLAVLIYFYLCEELRQRGTMEVDVSINQIRIRVLSQLLFGCIPLRSLCGLSCKPENI